MKYDLSIKLNEYYNKIFKFFKLIILIRKIVDLKFQNYF